MTHNSITRREALGLMGAGLTVPFVGFGAAPEFSFRVRTITAGIELGSIHDLDRIRSTITFLNQARVRYQMEGYVVQTIRIATQSLSRYQSDWLNDETIDFLTAIDALAVKHEVMFNIGPVIEGDDAPEGFGDWASKLNRQTTNISFTVNVASKKRGLHLKSVRAAAEAIKRIGEESAGGEGNFRFAAIAHSPARTPFYPAAFHEGPDAFGIGLQSPNVLLEAVKGSSNLSDARLAMTKSLDRVLKPLAAIARDIASDSDWIYNGVDVSPAPGIEASIGAVVESLTGAPFGTTATLSACAAITAAIQSVSVKTCGYSGLMLPPLEDAVLAQRMSEGRYGVQELLLYSSVCGTGLDVVPLPGSISIPQLEALIMDVGSLANRWDKPLSARLFPVPGKEVGDAVTFDSPFLVNAHVIAP